MATVTGLTAQRMLAIEAASVVGGSVVDDDLVLEKQDGSEVNAGNVRGVQGIPGRNGVTSVEDTPDVTLGIPLPQSYDTNYAVASGQVSDPWPTSVYKGGYPTNAIYGMKVPLGSSSVCTHRMMFDGDVFAVLAASSNIWVDLYVDGQAYTENPIKLTPSAGWGVYGFHEIRFPSAKPRLIEWHSLSGIGGVYANTPYSCWAAEPDDSPSVLVVGDSYVLPFIMDDEVSGRITEPQALTGAYQRMPRELGTTKMTTDGIGGSGYVRGGTANMPYGHATRTSFRNNYEPDILVVHGGGTNDLEGGFTETETINAAIAYFTQAATDLPNTKLVFVEGFSPPYFTPAVYNPKYINIRDQVQTSLGGSGIDVYYLSVASNTVPPLTGSGYVTNPQNDGNSDIYVGSDGAHLSGLGNTYLRSYLAPKIKRVMNDDGSLAGTLI